MSIREDLIEALPRLRAFAISRANSKADADDLVQESVKKILLHEKKLESDTKILPYAITVIKRLIIDGHRRVNPVEPIDGTVDLLTSGATQEDRTEVNEVLRLINEMQEMCREVLPMLGIGLTYDEISETLGIEKSTVGTRLLRCRKQLISLMEGTV
jgi:RNA polymerase sigma-70 factor, ECF subfamily